MSTVPNHARLLTLTARKSDVEYAMTMLSSKMQVLSIQNADLLQEKSACIDNYLNQQLNATDQDEIVKIKAQADAAQSEFDIQLAQLEAAQELLDTQQMKLETQDQAVTKEMDSVQKVLDSSIKEEFTYQK